MNPTAAHDHCRALDRALLRLLAQRARLVARGAPSGLDLDDLGRRAERAQTEGLPLLDRAVRRLCCPEAGEVSP